jgi:hypothetical protein
MMSLKLLPRRCWKSFVSLIKLYGVKFVNITAPQGLVIPLQLQCPISNMLMTIFRNNISTLSRPHICLICSIWLLQQTAIIRTNRNYYNKQPLLQQTATITTNRNDYNKQPLLQQTATITTNRNYYNKQPILQQTETITTNSHYYNKEKLLKQTATISLHSTALANWSFQLKHILFPVRYELNLQIFCRLINSHLQSMDPVSI